MKCMQSALSGTNLYLKLAIFATGLSTGFDSSLRQLLAQKLLILLYLLCEPSLYLSLFKALRRILPFLTGYWLFATFLAQPFLDSVSFSLQILYLLLVTVCVFGNIKLENLASDSYMLRKLKTVNAIFYYLIATYLFMKSFVATYAEQKSASPSKALAEQFSEVLHKVNNKSEVVRDRVRSILQTKPLNIENSRIPNLLGLSFLALLVVVHSV